MPWLRVFNQVLVREKGRIRQLLQSRNPHYVEEPQAFDEVVVPRHGVGDATIPEPATGAPFGPCTCGRFPSESSAETGAETGTGTDATVDDAGSETPAAETPATEPATAEPAPAPEQPDGYTREELETMTTGQLVRIALDLGALATVLTPRSTLISRILGTQQ